MIPGIRRARDDGGSSGLAAPQCKVPRTCAPPRNLRKNPRKHGFTSLALSVVAPATASAEPSGGAVIMAGRALPAAPHAAGEKSKLR